MRLLSPPEYRSRCWFRRSSRNTLIAAAAFQIVATAVLIGLFVQQCCGVA